MRILFVCTHNACRSVLCEVIARTLSAGRIEAASAGSSPAGQIHPSTLEQLSLHGYSSVGLSSKGFDDVESFKPEIVITVCDRAAGEPCPVWFGDAVRAHWGLPDPTHTEGSKRQQFDVFQSVITSIELRITALLQHDFESLDHRQLAALLVRIADDAAQLAG